MITLEEGLFVQTWKDKTGGDRVSPQIWMQYGDGGGKRRRESTNLLIVKKGEPVPAPEDIRSGAFTPYKTNMRRARQLRAKRVEAADDGELPAPKVRKITYDVLADELEQELKANKRTGNLTRFKHARKHLDLWFAGMRAVRMTNKTNNPILNYRNSRIEDGASNGTINRELSYLRQMLRLGHQRGKVAKLPKIETLEEPEARETFLELSEFKLLVEKAEKAFPYLVGFLEVCFWTGWRWKKTVRNLRWEHIRIEWLYAPGELTKNKKPVRRWLGGGPLGEAVKRQRQYVRGVQKKTGMVVPWMFCYPDGRQMRYPTDAFKAVAQDASFADLRLHDFCRSTWQVMVDAGLPEKDIMDAVGRKTRSIADRYNITSRRRLKAVDEKLSEIDAETEAAEDKMAAL